MTIASIKKSIFSAILMSSGAALAQQGPAGTTAASPAEGLLVQLPFLLALFALFYFALIRPQRQQAKQHAEFVSSLGRGDEIVTAAGLIGKITGLTDKVATIEVAPGTEIKILRSQIQHKWAQYLSTQA